MKTVFVLFLIQSVCEISFGQSSDRKLLIENNIFQINAYHYWRDAKQLAFTKFYNDSGQVIKSIFYSPEPDSMGNYIYGEEHFTYKNNQIIKDSSIWFDSGTTVTFLSYENTTHKGNDKVKTIATKSDGTIYSIENSKTGRNKKCYSRMEYFEDNHPFQIVTIRKNDKINRTKHIFIKYPKQNQKSRSTILSSSNDTLRNRIWVRSKMHINNKYKLIRTDELCTTVYKYDINGLLIEEIKTCEKKKREGHSTSYVYYEYLKEQP